MPDALLGVDVTKVYTSTTLVDPNQSINAPPLGTTWLDGLTGKRYKFIKCTGAWNAGDCIVIDETATDEPNGGKPCSAVSQVAIGIAKTTVALNGAGWVQISGEYPTANVTTASQAGDKLGTTATSGRLGSITAATPSNAEVIAAIAAATGASFEALDNSASNVCQIMIFGKV